MALSSKMLAVLQKIEAADAKHFAGLRASARQEAEAATRKRANEPPGSCRAGEEGTGATMIDGLNPTGRTCATRRGWSEP
jgi:hypothetical protein